MAQQENGAQERRHQHEGNRSKRVVVGSGSSVLAIVLAYFYAQHYGRELPMEVAVALSALIGSMTTTVALCFQDLRAIVLSRALKRRSTDRKRSTRDG